MSAINQKDAYKIGHKFQYPKLTDEIYSNFTARSGKLSNVPTDGVCFVGLQALLMDYFVKDWGKFFDMPKNEAVSKYSRRVNKILNTNLDVRHIEELHDLGYLPVLIKALPEGTFVPYGVPVLTIRNTLPKFYWVTNMLECVISNELWMPITSATTYIAFKRLFHKFAVETGSPLEFIPYQGHDFSLRGMPGRQAAAASGFAILAAGCVGTDNIPAIDFAEDYYLANVDEEIVGESVNATEHSVMCCGGIDGELELFKRLLTEVYPEGMLSVVSDSWDFWKVVTEYLPKLRETILKRNGKTIIRPDTGNPVDIICGTSSTQDRGSPLYEAEEKGLIECLWETFGGTINELGYKVLNPKIGAIYGDSITYDRAEEILHKLKRKGFASCNIVFGLGSYTFQYVTRDTHGFAVKSTNAVIDRQSVPIFKDPKTGDGTKKSARGYLMVVKVGSVLRVVENVDSKQERHGLLEPVFCDSKICRTTSLKEIRKRTSLWDNQSL